MIHQRCSRSGTSETATSKRKRIQQGNRGKRVEFAFAFLLVLVGVVVPTVDAFSHPLRIPNAPGTLISFGVVRKGSALSSSPAAEPTALPPPPSSSDSVGSDDPSNVPAALYTSDPNDHRYSASDWWQNMLSLPRSSILRATRGPVLSVALWSAFMSLLHQSFIWAGWDGAATSMCITSKPHSFLVSALGLLLVFRTNSAYQRFAEGRIIWERILSTSRNLSRMCMLYENDMGAARRRRVFRLLATFPYLLHHHIQPMCRPEAGLRDSDFGLALRRTEPAPRRRTRRLRARNLRPRGALSRTQLAKQNGLAAPVTATPPPPTIEDDASLCYVDKRTLPWCLLPESALQRCANSPNRPLWVCDRLSQEVTAISYTDNYTSRERLALLGHVDKLSQCIGECERIHQTAVPLNYARHLLRSLTLWLLTLPFAIIKDFGFLTGPVMAVISWMLYGIYQIGYSIEDPFQGSLRLSILCDAIYRDTMYGTDFMRRRITAFRVDEVQEWGKLDVRRTPPKLPYIPDPTPMP